MSNATYEIDPRLKTFYEGMAALHARFNLTMMAVLSAEYRDKILNEGMDPAYAVQEAARVGEFRMQNASQGNMSFQVASTMSQPIQDVKALNEQHILDDLERKADIFIEETNKSAANMALRDVQGLAHGGAKYRDYPIRDKADIIAIAVADSIEDSIGGNPIWNMDSADAREMIQYAATIVRQGYGLPDPAPATQQTYEQAAAVLPVSPEDTHGAAREILGDLKGRKGIRQAFDDIDLVTQVQIIQRMDDIIRKWTMDDPNQPKPPARFEDAMVEPEEPQLTAEEERISELWWAKVDQLKDEIDRGDRLINAHAAMLLNRVLNDKKNFDATWVDFQSFAEERQGAKRYSEQVGYFNVAHEWANKEGITPLEAAHGVAKALYIEHHQVIGTLENISREYNEVYDYNYAEQIKNRQIRAAKELFG